MHVGSAFIGTVGEDEALDFTALGDPVNAAARLAGVAAPARSSFPARRPQAAGSDTERLETRTLELRGRSEALAAVVVDVAAQGAHMAPR